jgi:hypothetical protein
MNLDFERFPAYELKIVKEHNPFIVNHAPSGIILSKEIVDEIYDWSMKKLEDIYYNNPDCSG